MEDLGWRLALLCGALVAVLVARSVLSVVVKVVRVGRGVQHIPEAPGSHWLLGHALVLLNSPTPWDLFVQWVLEQPPLVRVNILEKKLVLVGTAQALKEVFQTKIKLFPKDLDFSFQPLMPILGTGLVTEYGDKWQRQRLLLAPTLRVEILAAVVRLTVQALERLSELLEHAKRSGESVNIEEEFRLMTLQIIGAAVLSLGPEECNQVRQVQCDRMHAPVDSLPFWARAAVLLSLYLQQCSAPQHAGMLEIVQSLGMEHGVPTCCR